MSANDMSWEDWKAELDRLAIAGDIYGPEGAIEACGEESWRDYFEDGYSPQEALDEDIDYA